MAVSEGECRCDRHEVGSTKADHSAVPMLDIPSLETIDSSRSS